MDLDKFYNYLVQFHEGRLINLKVRLKRDLITKEEFDAAVSAEHLAWSDTMMALYSEYQFGKFIDLEHISAEDLKRFDTEKGFPCIGFIQYRGHEIPLYDDDYGQQVFGKLNGHDLSGGAYNFNYMQDIMAQADYLIDTELLSYGE